MTINPPASSFISADTVAYSDNKDGGNSSRNILVSNNPPPDTILHTYHSLITSATKLTAAFTAHSPILPFFFISSPSCLVTEHGPANLAPFLGRQIPIEEYLNILGTYCTYRDVVFSELCADPVLCEVVVKGRGVFRWIETGKEWEEVFVWRLGMRKSFGGGGGGGGDKDGRLTDGDAEGAVEGEGEWKVWRWQVWADTASLMLAKEGRGE